MPGCRSFRSDGHTCLPCNQTDSAAWLRQFIGRCQVVAGRLSFECDSSVLILKVRDLLNDLPDGAPTPLVVVARGLAGQLLARFACEAGLGSHPHVTHALARLWMPQRADALRRTWWNACEAVAHLYVQAHVRDADRFDGRVQGAIETVARRYVDPALTLRALAHDAEVSSWHLDRLLTRQTGRGFRALLHGTRVAAAHHLLITTSRTVKEIAAMVGYRSTTQLDRHVKKLCDASPLGLRARAGLRQSERKN